MLEPILGRVRRLPRGRSSSRRRRSRSSPTAPARWITDAEATDPDYWVGHLRGTVRFADCISDARRRSPTASTSRSAPARRLSSLAQAHGAVPREPGPERAAPPGGAHPRRRALPRRPRPAVGRRRRRSTGSRSGAARGAPRVPLPTYAFQRSPHFIAPGAAQVQAPARRPMREDDVAAWGWRPLWRPRLADCAIDVETELDSVAPQTWLVFVDEAGLGARIGDAPARRRPSGGRGPRRRRLRPHRRGPLRRWRPSAAATATTRWSATSSRAARCRPASRTSGW